MAAGKKGTTTVRGKSDFQQALYEALGRPSAVKTDRGPMRVEHLVWLAFHVALHGAIPGAQRKNSAGFRETTGRVQRALLKAIKRKPRER